MKRWIAVIGATLSMAILPLAVMAASGQPQSGGEIKILVTRPATNFGYPPKIAGPSQDYVAPFFNRLFAISNDDGSIQPELALGYKIAADGKSISIRLKEGIKFHDGTDFNAQSVKANLDNLIPPKSKTLEGIGSVDVVDDYTVKLNLPEYNNLVIYQLAANVQCYMYSPTALEKNGADWMNTHPVGTGPFKLKDYQPKTSMLLEKNADYWDKGKPYLDKIQIDTIDNGMTQMMTFKAKQANGIYNVVPEIAAQLRDLGNDLIIVPGSLYALTFDAKGSEIFSNPKVRMAIEYAIDKEAICNGPGKGLFMPAYQIVPTENKGYNKSVAPRKYDPEMARKLLSEAGYADGFSFNAYFQSNTWRDGVTAIKGFLEKVGINMEINYLTTAAYSKIRSVGEIEKGAAAQATFNTFSNDLQMMDMYMRSNSTVFQYITRPEGSDELVAKAKQSMESAETMKLVQEISKLAYEDQTVVPLWLIPRIGIVDKTVHDIDFFIYNDSSQNKMGHNTWVEK